MHHSLRALPFLIFPMAVSAQVPNGGFENWSEASEVFEPENWVTLNMLGAFTGVVFATEGTGAVGASCIELTTQEVTGIGILPSVAFVGDATEEREGFPFTDRPESFRGQLKYAPVEGDMASLIANFSRWDAESGERVDIGSAMYIVSGAVGAWTEFVVPVQYISEDMPDSAQVVLLSSMGETTTAGSTLSVDDLSFSSTTGLSEGKEQFAAVFPNPASTQLNISTNAPMRTIELWSNDGRLVRTTSTIGDRAVLDVASLPTGSYHVRAITVDGQPHRAHFVKE